MSNSPQWPLLYSGYIPNRDLQSRHNDQNFPFIPKSQKFQSQSVKILVKSFKYITSHYDVQASSEYYYSLCNRRTCLRYFSCHLRLQGLIQDFFKEGVVSMRVKFSPSGIPDLGAFRHNFLNPTS